MSELILGEQSLIVGHWRMLFKYLGPVFIANGRSTEEVRSRINLARFALSRVQSCLWSWSTKDKFYHAVMHSILLYGCETWQELEDDEKMLAVNIRRILHMRRTNGRATAPPPPH